MAMIGVAAALIIMTSSAGPAQAVFGIPHRQKGAPERLTEMPESVYAQREELADFVSCGTTNSELFFRWEQALFSS